jgi:hypothetical protein
MPSAGLDRTERPVELLAPRWHTAVLVALMVAVAVMFGMAHGEQGLAVALRLAHP